MTVLAADKKIQYKQGELLSFPVAASTKLYAGAIISLNAAGYAIAGADVAATKFVGVSQEHVDNSAGANGDLNITVRRKGTFFFVAAAMTVASIGTAVFIVDDQTVGVALTTANDIPCGTIVEFVSATEVGVDIDKF